MTAFSILSTLLSVWMVFDTCSSVCPSNCRCEGEANLKTVNCSGLDLAEFPETLPEATVRLDLSFNAIQFLSSNQTLQKLKVLDVSHNDIHNIDNAFFKNFPNLELLDLSVNGVKNIPSDMPRSLQVLHLNNNSIDLIEIADKSGAKDVNNLQYLNNLKILDLSGNDISTLSQCWLDHLPNLKYLYIARNDIVSIPSLACEKEDFKWEIADFSQNNITDVEHGVFKKFKYIKYVSLANNKLTNIPLNLPTLDWLDLSSNEITTLLENTTKDEVYPHEVVLLGGNPFYCDCNIQWLKEWYDTRKYLLKYIDVNITKFVPVCKHPLKVKDMSWDDVIFDDFDCDNDAETEDVLENKYRLNLYLEATNIGTNFVKLTWRNDGPTDVHSGDKVVLSYHPFGKKKSKTEIILNTSVGRHTLRGLESSVGYIVCVRLLNKGRGAPAEDCIEIFTESSGSCLMSSQFIWAIVLIVLIIFLIYWLWLCCFKSEESSDNNEKKMN